MRVLHKRSVVPKDNSTKSICGSVRWFKTKHLWNASSRFFDIISQPCAHAGAYRVIDAEEQSGSDAKQKQREGGLESRDNGNGMIENLSS